MPRPVFEPTDQDRNTVRFMIIAGVPRETIAKCIRNPHTGESISETTLLKHFKEELEHSASDADQKVVGSLFRTATGEPSGPQVTAAIFWCKTKLGWREVQRIEHGGSIAIENMTKEQLVAVLGQDD